MNKIEVDREQVLAIWNKAFNVVEQMEAFLQKPPEYYYNAGVCDVCKLLMGERTVVNKE